MRRIIGIGETIFDILFKDEMPFKAVPGGSVFNSMISLGRLGLQPTFLSEIGKDRVGDIILRFMEQNNISTQHMYRYYDGQSPVSLAFLDQHHEASYEFYMNYPADRLDIVWPRIDADDILIFGSYYSLKPELRPVLVDLLQYAKERKALVYYDPNFRSNHAARALHVMPSIIENLEFADIVRGSREDFRNIYNETDIDKIYRNHIRFYCPFFICTDGAEGVYLRTPGISKHYPALPASPVSLIGAGDALNAGILYAVLKYNITLENLSTLSETMWDRVIETGQQFAVEVCGQDENYISLSFADKLKDKMIY
ncbi:MAG: carbohydrate kinase [Bacteroidales bacterium]